MDASNSTLEISDYSVSQPRTEGLEKHSCMEKPWSEETESRGKKGRKGDIQTDSILEKDYQH